MALTLRRKTFIALGIMYFVWGATYIGIAYSIRTMPSLVSMVIRFFAATALIFLLVVWRKGIGPFQISRQQWRNCIILGIAMPATGLGILTVAAHYVPISVASLLVSAQPFWIALIRSIKGDLPSPVTWIGVVLGFIGVALILQPGQVQPRPDQEIGNVLFWMVLILVGNVVWAIASYSSKSMDLPSNIFVVTAIEMLVAGIALTPLALLRGEDFGALAHASLESWLGWGYLVIFGSLVGYSTYGWLLNNAPVSLASTYAYVNPVVAVFLAMLLLGEKLAHSVLVGGITVLVGVALVVTIEGSKKSKAQIALPE